MRERNLKTGSATRIGAVTEMAAPNNPPRREIVKKHVARLKTIKHRQKKRHYDDGAIVRCSHLSVVGDAAYHH